MPNFNSFVYDVSAADTPDIIRGDCYAIFRLSPEYKEDGAHFGFDWVRSGDALDYVAHDIRYEGNVGINVKGLGVAQDTSDIDLKFIEDETMYNSLCQSYLPGNITIFPSITGKAEKYHTPVLAIYPQDIVSKPAKLVLELNILKKPERIHLSYDKTLFEIQGAESLPCESGKHKCEIEIICKAEIKQEVYIYAMLENEKGEERLAGLIRVWRNDTAFRKKVEILLINLKFLESEEEDATVFVGNTEKIKETLNQYLPHAIIKPIIQEIECNLGFNLELRKRMLHHDGQISLITREERELDTLEADSGCIERLHDFLEKLLIASNINIANYPIVIISLGTKLCMLDRYGGIVELGGYNCNKYILIDNVGQKATPIHECLHSLGLNHTFNHRHATGEPTDYTYKVGITDNLMDYSHLFGINVINWWEWQWKHVRKNALPEE